MNGYVRATLAIFIPYTALCIVIVQAVESISGETVPASAALLLGGVIGAIGLGPLVFVVGEHFEECAFHRHLDDRGAKS